MTGKVLGIVGMGRIGQAVARRGHHGFEMEVVYYNRSAKSVDLPARQVEMLSDLMAAADLLLVASGTATLETLLLGRPMVVGYRMNELTYRLIRGLGLVKVPFIAMANLLAGAVQRMAAEAELAEKKW